MRPPKTFLEPTYFPRSTTRTLCPAFARAYAVAVPAGPAPMMATSKLSSTAMRPLRGTVPSVMTQAP